MPEGHLCGPALCLLWAALTVLEMIIHNAVIVALNLLSVVIIVLIGADLL